MTYMTFLIVLYLFLIDVLYMTIASAILPIIVSLKLFNGCDMTDWYKSMMDTLMYNLFGMKRMDVEGFRR